VKAVGKFHCKEEVFFIQKVDKKKTKNWWTKSKVKLVNA